MDIVQQFSDYILDFFTLQLTKNGTDRKLMELVADSEEFCQALVREVVTTLLQLKDDAIYKAIKEEKTHYVKERARARTEMIKSRLNA